MWVEGNWARVDGAFVAVWDAYLKKGASNAQKRAFVICICILSSMVTSCPLLPALMLISTSTDFSV